MSVCDVLREIRRILTRRVKFHYLLRSLGSVVGRNRFAMYERTLLFLLYPSFGATADDSYLVDPASGICLSQGLSHASVSMSELYNETANGSVKQL